MLCGLLLLYYNNILTVFIGKVCTAMSCNSVTMYVLDRIVHLTMAPTVCYETVTLHIPVIVPDYDMIWNNHVHTPFLKIMEVMPV